MNNILSNILYSKNQWIDSQEKKYPLNKIKHHLLLCNLNFYNILSKKKLIFILECKKATPFKGIINKNFNIINIANVYKIHSDVISVVTDEKYFHGHFNIMTQIKHIVTQPVLCKDFIISPWQIYFARLHQADAILLMLSILCDDSYRKLVEISHNLNMGVITEVTNQQEWQRAITLSAKVIGINNRNLYDGSINLQRTINLARNNKHNVITISESGINNNKQIRKLSKYVNGFLIGSYLMSQPNLQIATRSLLFGENKICGITRKIDANIAWNAGSLYGGLIFIPHSLRCIHIKQANSIVSQVDSLLYIGVFYNASISYIVKIASILSLFAIQLHGTEDQNYINKLKNQLPYHCNIWKAININQNIPLNIQRQNQIHRYLLDNGGGSGKTFNWKILNHIPLDNIILAGGLTLQNCKAAAKIGCIGLDFNSGVEIKPGIKDHNKINKIFNILRNLNYNNSKNK